MKKREWLGPAGLIALSFVPVVAGGVRLVQLGSDSVTPDNTRFFADPWPVVLHILGVSGYSLLGAFQFAPGFRKRKSKWHRLAGRVVVPLGLVASLSGLWMTLFYPRVLPDGAVLYALRLLVGSAMTLSLVLGMVAVQRRRYSEHGAWMLRAYALGLGAGTQVFTHIPYFVFPAIQGEATRALFMGLGWGINMSVAEWILHKKSGMTTHSAR